MMRGIRIGEILARHGVLTVAQVRQILDTQKQRGRPFGDLAERLFGVSPRVVEEAWASQYAQLAPVDDAELIEPDRQTLRLVTRRQAWQFHVVPVGREEGDLVLVTDRPNLIRVVKVATGLFREPVFIRVARTEHLRRLLMRVYPVPRHLAEYACGELSR